MFKSIKLQKLVILGERKQNATCRLLGLKQKSSKKIRKQEIY
jgi:hypothetical protein